jgi:glucose-6-phosphate dehydrogenase assembly protein OpcA
MTSTNAPSTLLGGQTHIDIRAIERELTELWKSAAQGEGDQHSTVTRACTLNLVVVTRTGSASQAVTDAVDRLTGTHPNRAIVVSLTSENDPSQAPLNVWVQAHCQIPAPGRPQVCCEQITIEARREGLSRIPGTILPLLVPDLPVVVWYPEGEPFRDQLFERLSELADRVIVDSERFVNPEGGLQRLAGLIGGMPLAGDLAWGRLTIWRELVAQCFDTPAFATQLQQIKQVRIAYELGCSRVPALMMIGWLATRLHWRLLEQYGPAEATELRMAYPNGEVLVEIQRSTVSGGESAHLAAIELVCPELRISIGSGEHSGTLMTRIEATGRPTLLRSARWQRPDTTELLAADLRLLGRDRTYEDSLRVAIDLI